MEQKKAVQQLTFVYFNSRQKRRVAVSSFGRLAAEACKVTENEVVASPVVDADGDDGGGIGVVKATRARLCVFGCYSVCLSDVSIHELRLQPDSHGGLHCTQPKLTHSMTWSHLIG